VLNSVIFCCLMIIFLFYTENFDSFQIRTFSPFYFCFKWLVKESLFRSKKIILFSTWLQFISSLPRIFDPSVCVLQRICCDVTIPNRNYRIFSIRIQTQWIISFVFVDFQKTKSALTNQFKMKQADVRR